MHSCYRVVKRTVQPGQNRSSLLERLVDVSLLGKEHSFESAAITEGHSQSQDAEADLIWDNNPMKSTFLCTIDSTSNERTNMRSLLFKNTLGAVENNVPISEGATLERNKECRGSSPGTLTILTYCSVVSIEFENIVRTEDDSNCSEKLSQNMGRTVDGSSSEPTDKPCNLSSNVLCGNERIGSGPKLTAVAVKYIDLKSDRKEVKLVKPSGGGEIILCAGVFESPRILLASGLGEWGTANDADANADNNAGADAVMRDDGAQRVESGEGASLVSADFTGAEALPSSPIHPSEHTETSATASLAHPHQAVLLKGIGRNLQDHTVLPIMCVGKWWNRDSTIKAVKERLRNALTVETETETANSSDSSGFKKEERSLDRSIPDVKKSSSVLSIGSVGSVLSIGSVGSIASIGKRFIYDKFSPFLLDSILSYPFLYSISLF